MSIQRVGKNQTKMIYFKKFTLYDNSETTISNSSSTVTRVVCNHIYINTGLTLQGVPIKRCLKCKQEKKSD